MSDRLSQLACSALAASGLLLSASLAVAADNKGGAKSAPPPAAAAPADKPLTPEQKKDAQFQVMAGEMAAGRGQPRLAAEAFFNALKIEGDPDLAARATRLALESGDLELTARIAARWLEIEPNSADAREVLSRLAIRRGDIDEAYAQTLAMVQGNAGGDAEGIRHVALLLSAESANIPEVMQVMQRLVAAYPKEAGAYYGQALVALRFAKLEEAETAARTALKLDAKSTDNQLLLTGVLVRRGKLDETDKLVAGMLKQAKPEQHAEVYMAYVRLLLDAGERDHARTQLQALLKEDDKNKDARYALALMAFNDGKLDEAEKLFTPLLDDEDRSGDVAFQLGRIAEGRRQYDKALERYRSVKTGSQAIEAAIREAAVLMKTGKVDDARELLASMRAQFPPLAPRLMQAEAEMLLELGHEKDALDLYNAGLAEDADDADMLYGRSLAYERLGRFKDAEGDLRHILKQSPNDGRALNALGYMLTVNTDRYDEARKLIEAALAQSPDDAAVIDSMGWVLFKQGHAKQASEYLEKALALAGDPEISAHLGEVLWTMGERERARTVWDQALAREPDHRVLRSTIDRLTR